MRVDAEGVASRGLRAAGPAGQATRGICLTLGLVVCAFARGGDVPAPSWPLWDGQETIEQYAKRAKLPTTKTLDLVSR